MVAELDQVEEQFGPYLVYERLGVGGMATVHRALERGIEGFERMVALKRLLPHLAEDASFIKSFVREAKLASLLNHVNIVQIFELGRVGAEYFISMEYIDGRDIRRILRHARKVSGPPPVNITVGILLQLCEALDYAHNKADELGQPLQLVHRDVSPSNVLVTSAGHVKIIDFGIAKAQSSQLRTQTGRVKGKLAYMAPEAITGKELDARSDLFAIGVIAHEMLTARPLFASKNEYQTLLKVQRGDIMPPSTFNQSCQPELDAIVLRALARDPDQRFSSASELRDDLIALRRKYNLQTGYRDITQWVDWAFSLEIPTASLNDVPARHKTPKPGKQDDDDVVEIAWGGGADEEVGDGGPVLLDEVPDVSEKHLQASYVDEPRRGDDIPAPMPSHGSRSRELPSQADSSLSFPPVNEAFAAGDSNPLRKRRATEPGHPPAPISNRLPRKDTLTTDPSAPPLDELDGEATLTEMTAADTAPSAPAVHPRAPTVRFKATTPPPMATVEPAIEMPPASPARVVRTKPCYTLTRTSTATPPPAAEAMALITSQRLRPKTTGAPPVGSGVIRPTRKGPRRAWVIMAGIVAAGACATAVTLYVTRGQDTVSTVSEEPSPRVRARTVATVKFDTEPVDANITIDGKLVHSGSPWATELEAGVHQLQIERKDHKAWLTSIDLTAQETQTLRVVLEPLGAASAVAEATLILRSTPQGLDAFLAGKLLAAKTPIKMPIPIGPHTITLQQGGVEVWRHDLAAKASTDYEFSPVMDAEHQRERAERAEPRTTARAPLRTPQPEEAIEAEPAAKEPELAVVPTPAPTPAPATPKEDPKPSPALARPAPVLANTPPTTPQITRPVVPTQAPPPTAKPVPPTTTPPPAPAAPRGPITVPPSAVTKLSGTPPEINKSKNFDLPPVVAAKVCIDIGGTVSSAEMLTKIERRAASDLVEAIRSWKYAPYKQSGIPTSACFAISFRVK
ncbi:hypothetical protein BH11MYX3_BH11MYX3_31760 [soil metagenome]